MNGSALSIALKLHARTIKAKAATSRPAYVLTGISTRRIKAGNHRRKRGRACALQHSEGKRGAASGRYATPERRASRRGRASNGAGAGCRASCAIPLYGRTNAPEQAYKGQPRGYYLARYSLARCAQRPPAQVTQRGDIMSMSKDLKRPH